MEEPADHQIDADAPILRHRLSTRLWHWVNALAIFTLLGSGLTISNAHRRLYWGQFGANPDHAWLSVVYWPGWVTIPSRYNLALARRWHLFFALIFAFGFSSGVLTTSLMHYVARGEFVDGADHLAMILPAVGLSVALMVSVTRREAEAERVSAVTS